MSLHFIENIAIFVRFSCSNVRSSLIIRHGEYLRAFNCYLADDVHADKMSTNSDIDPVVIRKNWRYNGVIRSRKSRDRQCNHPQKKNKGTINDLVNYNTIHKTKDGSTQNRSELECLL
jgi:hypothetical protein